MNQISHHINILGHIRSPYKEKFGIPRQPGLIQSADAYIELHAPYDNPEAFDGLSEFSHIWVSFLFHQNKSDNWKPKVRPPRLGGNEKLGVFATRSSFRPNGIGLSAIELKEVETKNQKVRLRIACPDMVDGTPIIDIKPYIAYSDSIEHTRAGFAGSAPSHCLTVKYSENAQVALKATESQYPNLKALITETLQYDPRPAYKNTSDEKLYGMKLYEFDIKWRVSGQEASVESVTPS